MTTEKLDPAPVTIAIVGTGAATGGGVAPTPDGTTAQTPAGQPNLLVTVVSPLMAIAVRFGHVFLTTLLGLVGAAMTPMGDVLTTGIPAGDFTDVVWRCAGLALPAAGVGLIRDLITVFGRLEGRYPLATGAI
jgi:hypothetical protein